MTNKPDSPFLPNTQIQYARKCRSAEEIVEELLAKATRLDNGCLICHLAPTYHNGHFRQYVSVGGRLGKKWRVTRLIWTIKKGPIDDALGVLHSCDEPQCIELEHLFSGTQQDNVDDMAAKGRAQFVNPRTDHIWKDEIRALHKQGLSRIKIADKLMISPSTVWNYISPRGPYYEV